MKLSEREKESMEILEGLDKAAMERKEKIERYAKYGLDYEKIEQEEALRRVKREELEEKIDRIISEHDLRLANRIWDVAWMMMGEGFENTEEGLDAFIEKHPELKEHKLA